MHSIYSIEQRVILSSKYASCGLGTLWPEGRAPVFGIVF